MDFENYRHFARPPFATSTFSQFADRNLPFTDFRVTRPEMGDYSYIQRGRSHSGREDGLTDGGPARRRISVAVSCASGPQLGPVPLKVAPLLTHTVCPLQEEEDSVQR